MFGLSELHKNKGLLDILDIVHDYEAMEEVLFQKLLIDRRDKLGLMAAERSIIQQMNWQLKKSKEIQTFARRFYFFFEEGRQGESHATSMAYSSAAPIPLYKEQGQQKNYPE